MPRLVPRNVWVCLYLGISWTLTASSFSSIGYRLLRTTSSSGRALFASGNIPIDSLPEESVSASANTATNSSNESARAAIDLGRQKLEAYFDYELDDWQLQAGGEILMGSNVIVCAPTGAGKTVCGEMALHVAFDKGMNGVYTTPLKALSNQKFSDLRARFGATNVGLSTGDISINRDNARVTVMTTEVYRNIAWQSSESGPSNNLVSPSPDQRGRVNDLSQNGVVVLDEFHYMGLPGRGGVWEECIITSPSHTQIVGLSATLPNAKELAAWISGVTGRKTVLIEAPDKRPVPLKYLYATREGIFPLFREENAGPGAPLGLLGYERGKVPHRSPKDRGSHDDTNKLPSGLRINPSLGSLAQRRIQRVNRMIQRRKNEQEDAMDDWNREDARMKGRRQGRSRGRVRYPMSNREERREKERLLRNEMRKAVPSLPILLSRLNEKDLLPAIFFIFSRAGCDEATTTIRSTFKGPRNLLEDVQFDTGYNPDKKRKKSGRSKKTTRKRGVVEDNNGRNFRRNGKYVSDDILTSLLDDQFDEDLVNRQQQFTGSPLDTENWSLYSEAGLLSEDSVRKVALSVTRFNSENEEIQFTNDQIENFLFGIGAHHAGMLPAHKAFVETLFRGGLMKAIMATETLAAGINVPARTTVIWSLAKRDGTGSMNLLETSNLLQMAGRAGRRGMDTAGTCVLAATPYEDHEVAAQILISPIKPISSQFRPSYSLVLNLIARGDGKLDVAKDLVGNSFASWEKQRLEQGPKAQDTRDILQGLAAEKFISLFVEVLQRKRSRKIFDLDPGYLQFIVETLMDTKRLKKASKEIETSVLAFELEETTFSYLQLESSQYDEEVGTAALPGEDDGMTMGEQILTQKERVEDARNRIKNHIFTTIVDLANQILRTESQPGNQLRDALQETLVGKRDDLNPLQVKDMTKLAKSTFVVRRQIRKLSNSQSVDEAMAFLAEKANSDSTEDPAWNDILALGEVLISFGCLKRSDVNEIGDTEPEFDSTSSFEVTPAGADVGRLSSENSLWCFLAVGGTFDVTNSPTDVGPASAETLFEDIEDTPRGILTQSLASTLVKQLKQLNSGEMAGYVSCLVCGDSARSSLSAIDIFQRLSRPQQAAIQTLLEATELFSSVQRMYSVDEDICSCNFDVSYCEVITAWANGCSWDAALEMSCAAPGDLTRIISRAMDGLRQFGSLQYSPIRRGDLDGVPPVDPFSRGVDQEIRLRCREAARAMNRFPVKDPNPFEAEEEDIFEDEDASANSDTSPEEVPQE